MKYTGSCHCGEVKYEVEMDLDNAISCNCSICQRKGTLLSFVPMNQFHLLQGENSLTDYQFNKNLIHHFFCSKCGVTSFAKGTSPEGQEMSAINIRCLDGVDLDQVKVTQYDGRAV